MKTVGLITEYNPFHNGHLHHIEQARAQADADFVVAVMSGDFVQRGAPAVFDKYTRTKMALLAGADLVLELPSIFATSSAEDFASGSIGLLDQLGIVDTVCFGSEHGQLDHLSSIAGILLQEPPEYSTQLKEFMKSGLSYPEARKLALTDIFREDDQICQVLDSPNNILGIEYIKALKKRNSSIKPVTILRKGKGYHDLEPDEEFGSASAIRHSLLSGYGLDAVSSMVPAYVLDLMKVKTPVWTDDFSSILNHTILTAVSGGDDLTQYLDISKELAARIQRYALEFCSFEERVEQLKTKQYTYTRISRALLHLILGIKTVDLIDHRNTGSIPYGRVLGFRSSSTALFSLLKQNSKIPLLTKTAVAGQQLDPVSYRCLQKDFYCSHLYQSICQQKTGVLPKNEFLHSVIKV